MLDSDWLTNVLRCAIIFRETHGERGSRQLSTKLQYLYHFTKWFQLFQKVFQQQYNQNQQDTGQIHTYSKQCDKKRQILSLFCHTITF